MRINETYILKYKTMNERRYLYSILEETEGIQFKILGSIF